MSTVAKILTLDLAPQHWNVCRRSLAQAALQTALCTLVITLIVVLAFPDMVYRHRVYMVWNGVSTPFGPPLISKRRLAVVVGIAGLAGLVAALAGHWCRMRRRPTEEA